MTTTPELSREQRDAAMVERYSDGETLDAIGQSFGITRERVRNASQYCASQPSSHGAWIEPVRSVQD